MFINNPHIRRMYIEMGKAPQQGRLVVETSLPVPDNGIPEPASPLAEIYQSLRKMAAHDFGDFSDVVFRPYYEENAAFAA